MSAQSTTCMQDGCSFRANITTAADTPEAKVVGQLGQARRIKVKAPTNADNCAASIHGTLVDAHLRSTADGEESFYTTLLKGDCCIFVKYKNSKRFRVYIEEVE